MRQYNGTAGFVSSSQSWSESVETVPSAHIQYLSGDGPLVNASNSAILVEVAVCIAH